ncbi:MAG: dicarboxylate/amino acid:cation symporter [Spirochaetales bacterium]|nr:dicarboxylate/amino acid:cation symporter [Spirochaetales bacterium]
MTVAAKQRGAFARIVKSPFVIIAAMIGGILIGIAAQEREWAFRFATTIAPVGQVYLNLLRMTIFPILISAIVTSIGKIFGDEESQRYLTRIVVYSLLFLLITSIASLMMSLVIQPGGGLSQEAQITLGRALTAADQSGESRAIIQERQGIFSFFDQLIPQNIFTSLGNGASLQILFFSIMLGVATGFLQDEQRKYMLGMTDALFKAFFTIIEWIMYLLPFGLFCLLAGQIATTGLEVIIAMAKFVVVVYIVSLVVFVASAIVISMSLRVGVFRAVAALKESLLIAFGTQSTFASMPAAIEGLSQELDVDEELVNLVTPLGVVVSRFSMIILYGVATIFAAQLYNIPLDFGQLLVATILVVFAAIAGAGTPGIVSLAMISIVFGPLGLPSNAIVILLLAVNPVIEPITTMTNIFAVSATTAFIAGPHKKREGSAVEEYA